MLGKKKKKDNKAMKKCVRAYLPNIFLGKIIFFP